MFLSLILTVLPALAADQTDQWKGAVCAALISGVRSEELKATHFDREVAEFRRSLRAFTPDIREESTDWELTRKDRQGRLRRFFRFHHTKSQPALNWVRYASTTPPDAKQTLEMAQRAYGIEYDIDSKAEGNFTYGFAIRGRDAILRHLDQADALTQANAAEIREFLRKKMPPWRGGNLVPAAVLTYIGYSVYTGWLMLLDPVVAWIVAAPEARYVQDVITGRRRRTHVADRAAHVAFMREQLNAEVINPQTRVFYGTTLGLEPSLIEALKAATPDDSAVKDGMLEQTRLDRAAWFEQWYHGIRTHGADAMVSVPRDTGKDAAFDEILYVDSETGEPVYIFAARFFKERPIYPKKPREMKDFERQRDWVPAGA